MRVRAGIAIALLACTVFGPAVQAAQGEMGTGVPHFGLYSSATGTQALVTSLADATVAFPAGCTSISLNPQTMGLDAYKIAVAVMTVAKVSNRRVRFYAHAVRDGGCGVDYVAMQ